MERGWRVALVMTPAETFLSLLFAALAFSGIVAAGMLPREGGDMVVFAAPGAGPARASAIVARAGGELVAATGLGWAVIARSNVPGFSDRLYDSGAVLVADSAVAALCAP